MLSMDPLRRPTMGRVVEVLRKYGNELKLKDYMYHENTELNVLRASRIIQAMDYDNEDHDHTFKVLSQAYTLLQNAFNMKSSSDDLKALCVYQLARVHEALWRHLGAEESRCDGIDHDDEYDTCFFCKGFT